MIENDSFDGLTTSHLADLIAKLKQVKEDYRQRYPDVKMDRDYVPFKLTEEWGECLQTYLMLTDRGRQKGKSKAEIKQMFTHEMADVFAYLLLLADDEGVDLVQALEEKWFKFLQPGGAAPSSHD